CPRAVAARPFRCTDRLRARAARPGASPDPPVGEAEPAPLRGAARLLPRCRREGPRMTVSLVGAGPGDPELITIKGLARVRACQVIVYDRRVAPELVAEAPAEARRIERDGLDQENVNLLLVAHG